MKNGNLYQKRPLLYNIYNSENLCINSEVCIITFFGPFSPLFGLKSCNKKLHKKVINFINVFVYIAVFNVWTLYLKLYAI